MQDSSCSQESVAFTKEGQMTENLLKHSYDNDKSYETNFSEAYRRYMKPDADEEELKKAGMDYSLYVPMNELPWFKGFVPIQAIKEDYRSTFTPSAAQTRLIENVQGLEMS